MYTPTIRLKDNERLLDKVNLETGEVTTIPHYSFEKKSPKDKSMDFCNFNQSYQRSFTKAWLLLETQTSDVELKVAHKLALLAKAYTNSLEPMSPDSTLKEISDYLDNIGINSVSKIIDKLFKLGVIGKFEVYDRFESHQIYWIFNPYLSFNGKTIKRDVKTLFDNTYYAKI